MNNKVSLIIPPSIFLMDERVFMTLGILKVAAVLEAEKYVVEVLDLSGVENYIEAVEEFAVSTSSKFFGITSTTPQLPYAAKIAEAIRNKRPDARLILGGPHVTLVNAACKYERKIGLMGRARKAMEKLEAMFDVLVAGDGEIAIFEALQDNPPKLVDADDPSSTLFLTNKSLEKLPFPARHLVDVPSYRYTIDGVRALSLIAQLGCPFACGFCGGRQSPSLRRIRTRSPENIVEEMVHMWKTYGIHGFMLYDDELNVNQEMVRLMKLITEKQKELGVTWALRGFIKSQLFTDEQAAAQVEAGFKWNLVGFESGSEKILTNINKKATRDENTRCMEIARRHGLKIKALMSIGHPGESSETIKATQDWLLEVKPDDFDVSIITAYPGTPYYDHAIPSLKKGVWTYTYKESGDKLHQIDIDHTEVSDYYKGDPDDGYAAYVFTDHLSAEDIVRERKALEFDVRRELGIPFPPKGSKTQFEHSMGQSGGISPKLLRTSV